MVEVEGNTALAFQENGERFHDTAMERIVELKYYYKLLYPVVYTYQCTMLRAGYPYTIREVYRDRNGCNSTRSNINSDCTIFFIILANMPVRYNGREKNYRTLIGNKEKYVIYLFMF